jgi:2-C-methyl-D-erythritol 4-phosphate cytidylyltransferase
MLLWSVEMLQRAGCRPIVMVVPSQLQARARELTRGHTDVLVLAGGPTRRDSVANGLARLDAERVVVHDAARPCASPELVERVLRPLGRYDGVIAALPVDETLKRVSQERVEETIDRSDLWLAQTPQAFVTASLRAAHEDARTQGLAATDDAQLVELCGGTVAVVHGARCNIKLTYPGDFFVAEAIVRRGRT